MSNETPPQTQAMRPVENPTADLRAFLVRPAVHKEIGRIAPKAMAPERLTRQLLTLAQANGELLKCSHMSMLAGLIRAAELNLELSGVLGHCYLVPRWNGKKRCLEATFQIGYRGFVALAFRSGQVKSFTLRTVHAEDEFHVQLGSNQRIHHMPKMCGIRGPAVAYYALVKLTTDGEDFEFMSVDEVIAHRMKYSPPKTRNDGGAVQSPWDTNFDEMAMKTVARKLAKRIPLSVDCAEATLLDDAGEAGHDLPPVIRLRQEEVEQRLVDSRQAFPDQQPDPPPAEELTPSDSP